MEITWLGHSCFRLKGKDAIVVTDPYGKETGYVMGRVTADIVTVSHQHPGHNAVSAVAGTPRVIAGPGEYEIANAFIIGLDSCHDQVKGAERGKNIIFLIEMDDITVCHLGDLGHTLSAEQVEALSAAHVLLVPVGGTTTIDAARAAETVRLLEPKLVIPMHYKTEAISRDLAPVDRFLREMGLKETQPEPKLSVTKTTLPPETRVVVLDYRRQGAAATPPPATPSPAQ